MGVRRDLGAPLLPRQAPGLLRFQFFLNPIKEFRCNAVPDTPAEQLCLLLGFQGYMNRAVLSFCEQRTAGHSIACHRNASAEAQHGSFLIG